MSEETYHNVRSRLDEILEEVKRDDISLDDALALYEEAVKLSLDACDLSESDLALDDDLAGEAQEADTQEKTYAASEDVPSNAVASDVDEAHFVSSEDTVTSNIPE